MNYDGKSNGDIIDKQDLSHPQLTETFYLNHMVVRVWKYDALIVAAYLLNARLALHPINVLIAGGKNVVAGCFYLTTTQN